MEFQSLPVLRKNRFILMFNSFDTSAAWNPDQLKEKKDWIFEINKEASDYIAENIKKVFEPKKDLFDYSRDEFDLGPILENVSNAAKKAYSGYGLSLIKGLPRNTLNNQEFKLLIWAIGLHLGVARPQGMFSQYISEVKATGMNYRSNSGRGYNSNAKLDFHTDGCDLVGLACYNKAMKGGQSLIASSITACKVLFAERPDLAEVAMKNFYFSHNEEQIPGECPYYVQPLFDIAEGHLFGKWNWNRVRTAQKMKDIPKLSLSQLECINFLEIGVGSGCIILSILKEKKFFKGKGVDLSKDSIKICKKNANKLNVSNRLKLFKSDIDNFNLGKYDLIISNPPYVKKLDLKKLDKDIKDFEPYLALNGGLDGLSEIRKVINKATKLTKKNGKLILEIAFNQKKEVKKILMDKGFFIEAVIKDYSKNDRCIISKKI